MKFLALKIHAKFSYFMFILVILLVQWVKSLEVMLVLFQVKISLNYPDNTKVA